MKKIISLLIVLLCFGCSTPKSLTPDIDTTNIFIQSGECWYFKDIIRNDWIEILVFNRDTLSGQVYGYDTLTKQIQYSNNFYLKFNEESKKWLAYLEDNNEVICKIWRNTDSMIILDFGSFKIEGQKGKLKEVVK